MGTTSFGLRNKWQRILREGPTLNNFSWSWHARDYDPRDLEVWKQKWEGLEVSIDDEAIISDKKAVLFSY